VTNAVVDGRLDAGQIDEDQIQGRIGPRRAGGIAGVAERLARTAADTDDPTQVSRMPGPPIWKPCAQPTGRLMKASISPLVDGRTASLTVCSLSTGTPSSSPPRSTIW
jgi:hypothetical protein